MSLNKPPKYRRASLAKGLAEGATIDAAGGKYGAGLIEGFAVITRGEALGHGYWIDETFVAQTAEKLSAAGDEGEKSRFTHPDLSGDGLAKGLGRVVLGKGSSSDTVRGDLHIWQSARRSPDGDLGAYVLKRAEEDPKSFGASISFAYDWEAEKEFALEHGAEEKIDPYWGGKYLDYSTFKSPDPLNVNNLPHARLRALQAVDFVDEPAANPSGLFHRDETFKEAEGLLEYALGLSDRKPELVNFDLDPDRVGGFVRRFFDSRGLTVGFKIKNLNDGGDNESTPETPAGDVPVQATSPEQDNKPKEATPAEGQESPTSSESATPQLSGRDECKRFLSAFGDADGARYFAEGLTFEQAQTKHIEKLSAQVKALEADKKALSAKLSAGEAPLSSGGADDKKPGDKTRAGFASKIKVGPSRN